eukprot:935251-Prorocentrum_minimum.AAC.1
MALFAEALAHVAGAHERGGCSAAGPRLVDDDGARRHQQRDVRGDGARREGVRHGRGGGRVPGRLQGEEP